MTPEAAALALTLGSFTVALSIAMFAVGYLFVQRAVDRTERVLGTMISASSVLLFGIGYVIVSSIIRN